MHRDNKKNWKTVLGTSFLISSMAIPFLTSVPSAFASTTAQASTEAMVVHAAYLKTSPHLGTYNEIKLLGKGTSLQVLSTTPYWLQVRLADGVVGYITANHYYVSLGAQTSTSSTSSAPTSHTIAPTSSTPNSQPSSQSNGGPAAGSVSTALPPGVTLAPNIQPLVPMTASYAAKLQAVEQIAKSKLGTPYIWGHNEDRGQYGFDCSNYVEYVFHEALGYNFSGSSKVQFDQVGWPVPISQISPGDELFFSNTTNPSGSAHVGIYIGHGEMIEEGGGLGKVGYLSITQGFWSHHLVAVHRLF